MKMLSRTQYGNPILRSKARTVSLSFLKTKKFQNLRMNMIYTMRRTHGVGLAASQIGEPLSIAVIETRPTPTRPKLMKRGPITIINPRIISYSKNKKADWEGCLSFPNVRGSVSRPESIIVTYQDENGKKITEKATGLWARILQHEIDHLNGIVYLDRMENMKSIMTLQEFKKRVLKK